jgi:hypothetical protein
MEAPSGTRSASISADLLARAKLIERRGITSSTPPRARQYQPGHVCALVAALRALCIPSNNGEPINGA